MQLIAILQYMFDNIPPFNVVSNHVPLKQGGIQSPFLRDSCMPIDILSPPSQSRLTVVSREAKKGQSDRQKTKRATNNCVSFTRANVFVI